MRRVQWSLALALILSTLGCGGNDPAAVPDTSPTTGATQATGELVDIGNRSLFVTCQNDEATGGTIVLEAGLTGDSRTWTLVVKGLQTDMRVCTYDRANTGQSEPAPKPRSAQDVVDDLEALLEAVEAKPPYVLVGFSMGGIFTQLYAAEHSADIGGLVLVESNHYDEQRQIEQHLTPAQIALDREFMESNPEGIDIMASFAQVKKAGPLPEVPLVVVTATVSGNWPSEWGDPAIFDKLREEQQADLAASVPGGKQIFAESGHEVPGERSDVVLDAINQVLDQL